MIHIIKGGKKMMKLSVHLFQLEVVASFCHSNTHVYLCFNGGIGILL